MPRKNVEYIGTELLVAMMLSFPTLQCNSSLVAILHEPHLLNAKIKFNKPKDKIYYVKDLFSLSSSHRTTYINNFRTRFLTKCNFNYSDICNIYISGKSNKHIEIIELNKTVNKTNAKADVYVKLIDGTFIGFSVKQSKDATKTNLSIQKMFGKEDNNRLTKIRKEFLIQHGFPTHNDTLRDEVNNLFYITNIYWENLRLMIEKHKQTIIHKIIDTLFALNLKYDLYEYNGVTIQLLNYNGLNSTTDNILFEEYEPYYYTTNGNKRQTAKLFYRLCILDKIYRVEIRFKGDIHNASPQFQLHEEHEEHEE